MITAFFEIDYWLSDLFTTTGQAPASYSQERHRFWRISAALQLYAALSLNDRTENKKDEETFTVQPKMFLELFQK